MSRSHGRVLALAPVSRGLGIFATDRSGEAIDWRVIEMRGERKNAQCQVKLEALIEEFKPILVVLEDHRADGSQRRERLRELLDLLAETAASAGVRVSRVGPRDVRRRLGLPAAANKDLVAAEVAKRYPVLAPRLPKPRKAWQIEQYTMAIFTAAALAIAS